MLLTPTYHVYEMFLPHRDGQLVACEVKNSSVLTLPDAEDRDAISVSATLSEDGKELFLSILNLDLGKECTGAITITPCGGWEVKQVRRLTTEDIRSHNTFKEPDRVRPQEIPLDVAGDLSGLALPPQSITTIRMARAGK